MTNHAQLHQMLDRLLQTPQAWAVSLALSSPCEINAINPGRDRLLHTALRRHLQLAAGCLLNAGADPNLLNHDKQSALCVALLRSSPTSMIQQLLAHGADPCFVGPDGADMVSLARLRHDESLASLIEQAFLAQGKASLPPASRPRI